MLDTHRPPGVHLLRTHADFRSQPELISIGKASRRVPVDRGRVDIFDKAHRPFEISGQDRVRVLASILVYVSYCLLENL